jgi:hypothetical protein
VASEIALSTSAAAGRVAEAGAQAASLISEASTQVAGQVSQASHQAASLISTASAEERTKLEAETQAAIQALTQAAADARATSTAQAEAARQQVDQLAEMAFGAGQKANQAYDARLEEARTLIEKSAEMIDQAGATTALRLEEGAAAARGALEEMQRMLTEIEARSAALPDAARGQAEQVRAAVAGSMEELLGQARRAAAETQAIDEAFQGRVRRNYEILSEAVRLMGTVAAVGGLPSAPGESAGWLAPPPPPAAPPMQSLAPPEAEAPLATEDIEPVAPAPVVEAPRAEPGIRERFIGLKPRLRLTPTASDEEVASIFDAGAAKPEESAESEGWTWKDLLSSIDEAEGGDSAELQEELAREIAGLGVDLQALLPMPKVDELSVVIQGRDLEGAREVVRALAPAANRRLTRRLFTDEKLKRRALTFLGRFRGVLAEAADTDPAGFELAAQLNTPAGRIYLILDAAAGDIT